MIACRTLGQWNKVNVWTGYVWTVGVYCRETFELYVIYVRGIYIRMDRRLMR